MAISLGNDAFTASAAGDWSPEVTITIQSDDDFLLALEGSDADESATVTLDPGGANEAVFTQVTDFPVAPGNGARADAFYLLEADIPPAGDYAVEFDHGGDTHDGLKCHVRALQGAAQEQPEVRASSSGATTSISTDITPLTDGAFVFDVFGGQGPLTLTVGSGQTEDFNSSADASHGAGSYTGPVDPASQTTMSWSAGSTTSWAHGVLAIAPASTGGILSTHEYPYEHLVSGSMSEDYDYETLILVTDTEEYFYEWLSDVSSVSATHDYPYEWLASVVGSEDVPYEHLLVVAGTEDFPYEWLQGTGVVIEEHTYPYEVLAAVSGSHEYFYEVFRREYVIAHIDLSVEHPLILDLDAESEEG